MKRFSIVWCVFGTFAGCAPATSSHVQSGISPDGGISLETREGTWLSLDLSPDGREIVFDLLGQLWSLPQEGGPARPLTDAVRDTAEDLDPSLSPDGTQVLFQGDRRGEAGLWLLTLSDRRIRRLTEETPRNSRRAAWSPDGRRIAFAREITTGTGRTTRRYSALHTIDAATAVVRTVNIDGLPAPSVRDPSWSPDGREIVLVNGRIRDRSGGRIWRVNAEGGIATPVSGTDVKGLAPVYSPDGSRIAFFAADSAGRVQVWMQRLGAASPERLTDQRDVAPTRVRWYPDGHHLLYSADGRLWRVAVDTRTQTEIPFVVRLRVPRSEAALPPVRFHEPGERYPARGHTGLALAPDGQRLAVLALGKLWLIPVGSSPRAVTSVPAEARYLTWSPEGLQVAWSAGAVGEEDLFATDLTSGRSRRVTALPGRERFPRWSPDGKRLLFSYTLPDSTVGRISSLPAEEATVTDPTRLGDLGRDPTTDPSNAGVWSPDGQGVLIFGRGAAAGAPGRAALVAVDGRRTHIQRFPTQPTFVQWRGDTLTYLEHDRLWRVAFRVPEGIVGTPAPAGEGAALYLSSSQNGSFLHVSADGLRLLPQGGEPRMLGWPLRFTASVPEPLVVRNARVIDGSGSPASSPQDLLLVRGRIARVVPAGRLRVGESVREIDASGRWAVPGFIDLHAHFSEPSEARAALYSGVTTARDQGGDIAVVAAQRDGTSSGVWAGPRVSFGGFQYYTDWPFSNESGRGLHPEADSGHLQRAVALLQAYGADHLKLRTFSGWSGAARLIAAAHDAGMRVTSHCAHQLPLVVAGVDTKEHLGGNCAARSDGPLYDDLVQIYRAGQISVVPTLTVFAAPVRYQNDPHLLEGPEMAGLLSRREQREAEDILRHDPVEMLRELRGAQVAVTSLHGAGVPLGTGTDMDPVPWTMQIEMEALVEAGLTPLEAIRAATGDAARIMGAAGEVGMIAPGQHADLVLLDGDPSTDIRNARRIWHVIQSGHVVDREALRGRATPDG